MVPAIAMACVAVFAAMAACGVSPSEPRIGALLDWGAELRAVRGRGP